jgi:hypothetical protein
MNSTQKLKETIISILDDEHGIPSNAYTNIIEYVNMTTPTSCDEIFNAVIAQDNRYFLPEGFTL